MRKIIKSARNMGGKYLAKPVLILVPHHDYISSIKHFILPSPSQPSTPEMEGSCGGLDFFHRSSLICDLVRSPRVLRDQEPVCVLEAGPVDLWKEASADMERGFFELFRICDKPSLAFFVWLDLPKPGGEHDVLPLFRIDEVVGNPQHFQDRLRGFQGPNSRDRGLPSPGIDHWALDYAYCPTIAEVAQESCECSGINAVKPLNRLGIVELAEHRHGLVDHHVLHQEPDAAGHAVVQSDEGHKNRPLDGGSPTPRLIFSMIVATILQFTAYPLSVSISK